MADYYITGFKGSPDPAEVLAMEQATRRAGEVYALAGLDAPVLSFCESHLGGEHNHIGPCVTIARPLLASPDGVEQELVAQLDIALTAQGRHMAFLPVASDPYGMGGSIAGNLMFLVAIWMGYRMGDRGLVTLFSILAGLNAAAILWRFLLDRSNRRRVRKHMAEAFAGSPELAGRAASLHRRTNR